MEEIVLKKIYNFLKVGMSSMVLTFFLFLNKIYASNIGSSQIAKGLDKLLKDLTSWARCIINRVYSFNR